MSKRATGPSQHQMEEADGEGGDGHLQVLDESTQERDKVLGAPDRAGHCLLQDLVGEHCLTVTEKNNQDEQLRLAPATHAHLRWLNLGSP